MGTITAFPGKRVRPVPKKRKSKGVPWRAIDLQGKRPRGHPLRVKFGPRGKVLLALGQVWVEGHNDRLWRVTAFTPLYTGRPGYQVTLAAYRGAQERVVSEQTLRLCMDVWDTHFLKREQMMQKLLSAADHDPRSPFKKKGGRISALKFFGLDAKGNRTD